MRPLELWSVWGDSSYSYNIMKEATFRRISVWGQIGLWVILFLIYGMDEWGYSSLGRSFFLSALHIAITVGLVYFHYYILLPYFVARRRWIYFPCTFLLISAFAALSYLIDNNFPFPYDYEPYFWWDYIYNLFFGALLLAVTSIYYFVEAWFRNIQKESALRTEKLQAEVNFLKSQINPHFLFNTLNNIYSFAQTGNKKTAPMLERLSNILRFMVYDCSEEQVSLDKEIRAVDDLIEIYKMKNSEQKNISFTVEGVKSYLLTSPLIIVNVIENAFKHSDAINNKDGFIKIELVVAEKDQCQLEVSNSVKKRSNPHTESQGGLGLSNIKKRLELQYGVEHNMNEELKDGVYNLKLEFPLNRK